MGRWSTPVCHLLAPRPRDHVVTDCPSISGRMSAPVGAIRHSLTPITTIMEAHRLLRPGGTLIMLESPSPVLGLEAARGRAIRLSRDSGVTQICYTRRDHEFMLRQAGFDRVRSHPVDTISRGMVRRALRGVLRRTGVEDLVRPPTYLFVATK